MYKTTFSLLSKCLRFTIGANHGNIRKYKRKILELEKLSSLLQSFQIVTG